jgi:alpha-glucosidase
VPTHDGVYTSDLHEDDGLTFRFAQGACYRTTFRIERRGQQVTVTATVRGDGFREFARETLTLVIHGATPTSIVVNGVAQPLVANQLTFANRGQGFTVSFTV